MSGLKLNFPFGYRNGIDPNGLYGALFQNSLLGGLQLSLDAGDYNSWDGGNIWNDLGPNALDFNPAGTLPTFNGSIGGCSANEYFSYNGSNYWTCASGNPTFTQNIHKPNATYSFLVALNYPSFPSGGNSTGLFDTFINGSSGAQNQPLGFRYEITNAIPDIKIGQNWSSGLGTVMNNSAGSGLSTNTWHIIGASVNIPGSTGFFYKDGSLDTATESMSYSSPTSSNDPNPFKLNGSSVTGSKIAFMAIWNIPLTKANFDTIFGVLRGRFGI